MADTEKKRGAGASRKRGSSRGVKAAEKTAEKTIENRTEQAGAEEGTRKRGSSRRSAASKKSESPKGGRTGAGHSGRAAGRRKTLEQTEQDGFMKTEVAIIVTFAVSVLLFLSNFGLCGAIGGFCRGIMLGIFGLLGYLAPVLFLIGTCFYLSNLGNRRAVIKLASVGLVLLSLCGLNQMLFGGGMQEGWKLSSYYRAAAAGEQGGGFLGGLLAVVFSSLLGRAGAYIVLLLGLVVGGVCITEKSLVSLVKRSSGRAYQYAREDMSRRRELHEERKERQRRVQQTQKVRGVNLDVTALMDLPVPKNKWKPEAEENVLEKEPLFDPEAPLMQNIQPEEAVNPADLFRGKIQGPDAELPEEEILPDPEETDVLLPEPEEEPWIEDGGEEEMLPPEEAEPSLPEPDWSEPEAPEPELEEERMEEYYLRRDTRTVAELSGGTLGASVKTGLGYQEVAAKESVLPVSSPLRSLETKPEAGAMDFDPVLPEQLEREAGISLEEAKRGAEQPAFREEAFPDWPEEEEPFVDQMLSVGEDERSGAWSARPMPRPEGQRQETSFAREMTGLAEKQPERLAGRERTDAKPIGIGEKERGLEAEPIEKKEYLFPPLSLLKKEEAPRSAFSDQEYKETAIKLQQTLQNFGVGVTVTNISCGPTVTRYELHPEQGVKVSKIVALADDIKLNLAAADIRIEAPIPGKAAVGIEVPNKENSTVLLRDLLESASFQRHDSRLAFAVGKDIGGQTVVSDIAKMPHLLIAGATGSGKSVCINTLIMSVIYKAKPDEVKLIMIDPKVVELSVYNGIPHLLIPVVTDPKKASGALNWAVAEMMERYEKFAKYGVRDLKGFNAKVDSIQEIEDPKKPQKLPQIIIIVDELADLMMVAPGEVEDAICRLAQLARAAGIHLVIATQRPSVNVITGVIKANIPSRIAFSVSSGVDSRTIIDMVGAEKLLGKGDMLFYPSGYQKPQRVQGAFVSDQEVSAVVEFLTEQGMTAEYSAEIQSKIGAAQSGEFGAASSERDTYFVQAGRFIIEKDKASIGMLQRMFKIGFNRAARIMDQLADAGVVGEEEGTKPRKVLMSMEQFENLLEQE